MKETVWIVFESGYDGEPICGVFTTATKADEWIVGHRHVYSYPLDKYEKDLDPDTEHG